MKFALPLLFIGVLAIGPVGCNRDEATDESVSANADRAESSEQTRSESAVKERSTEPQRQAVRESRPAYRAPETRTSREVEERAEERVPDSAPAPRSATVTSGTAITVTLADTVGTENNNEGDSFTAHLSQPIIVNGRVVAEKGDRVTGHISKLQEPGRVKGKARLELVLDEIRTGKETHKLSTEPFIAVSEDTHGRDAAEIGGGAAVGAAIGAITGGKKGAAVGAVIGGGTGTTAVLLTRGKQLKLEPETKVNFVLSRDLELRVIRTTST